MAVTTGRLNETDNENELESYLYLDSESNHFNDSVEVLDDFDGVATDQVGSVTNSGTVSNNKKPPNTAFRQQRLKAWQPILSPRTMIPTLLIVTVIFAPIGIGLLVAFLKVQHIIIDYSHCSDVATSSFTSISDKYLDIALKDSSSEKKIDAEWKYSDSVCTIQFTLVNELKHNLYMYYKLTNFYQNHRKYVESYDLSQLQGHAVNVSDLNDYCKPLKEIDGKPIYPCGLIANSFFNDTISLKLENTGSGDDYTFSNSNIAWKSDKKIYKKTQYNPDDIVPPPNWYKTYPDGYTDDNLFDISEYEDLLVWMRTAGMPSFYKLKGKNENDNLAKGTYQITITNNFPVDSFGGTKSLVITSNSVIGGRNISLPLLYLITSAICVVFVVIFFINTFIIKPKKSITEHSYLNGNDNKNNDIEMNNEDGNTLQQQLHPLRDIL
ncbi:hypothetical protein ACO0SA_000562 [Hanseniaspora valbyensis]